MRQDVHCLEGDIRRLPDDLREQCSAQGTDDGPVQGLDARQDSRLNESELTKEVSTAEQRQNLFFPIRRTSGNLNPPGFDKTDDVGMRLRAQNHLAARILSRFAELRETLELWPTQPVEETGLAQIPHAVRGCLEAPHNVYATRLERPRL